MAFGSILEGPNAEHLKPIVEQAMPFLFKLMHDQSVNVRDTAAWTIGRVCEIIPDAAVASTNLQPLLQALVTGLTAEPRVASNVCWAFSSLAEAAYETASQVRARFSDVSIRFLVNKYLLTRQRMVTNLIRTACPSSLSRLSRNCWRLRIDRMPPKPTSVRQLTKLSWKWSRTHPRIVTLLCKKLRWLSWSVFNR